MANIISSFVNLLRDPTPLFTQKSLDDMLNGVPDNIADYPIKIWDAGVFNNSLINEELAPDPTLASNSDVIDGDMSKSGNQIPGNIISGTYDGSQMALLEIFQRIENSFAAYYAAHGVETDIPIRLPLDKKRELYQYQPHSGVGSDQYPPHLSDIPWQDKTPQLQIFNFLGLAETTLMLPKIIPDNIINSTAADLQELVLDLIKGTPQEGATMKAIFENNKKFRNSGTDIMRGANIGDCEDWYSDARFAQQYFSGTNPTTITKLSDELFTEFMAEAKKQNRGDIEGKLSSADRSSLYVNDCSWYRTAIGFVADKELISKDQLGDKYACAAVTLFELNEDGKLHPLSIVIDYKGSMDKSVVIFNQRLDPSQSTRNEAFDWPWRYAKTCAQVSDWMLHELLVHLGRTHLVEEATIVATHRTIPETHIIYQLLSPHWLKTLSLNAAARSTLVPKIIVDLTGFEGNSAYDFILYDYHKFDWTKRYVPNDLEDRGFPPEKINDSKYCNYRYGQDIHQMWTSIRKYVSSMLSLHFPDDATVQADQYIRDWCKEIQSENGAQIKSFPTITTLDQLTDAVTMCIHLASPQHTAINYLQNFYQGFVVNRPGALFTRLPSTIDALQLYKEKDLVLALPINRQRQWLLLATIPWLLSFRPAQDANLINYAASVYKLMQSVPQTPRTERIQAAAREFYSDLQGLIKMIHARNKKMTMGHIPYTVLDPFNTATAIII